MTARRTAGQALAEFAIVIPVLLLLFLAIFDFGRAVYAYNTVSNASREAVRVAIVDQDEGVVEAEARAQAIAIAGPGLTIDVSGVKDASCRKIGCITRVGVAYLYEPIMPLLGSIVGPITVSTSSEMPIERIYDSVP